MSESTLTPTVTDEHRAHRRLVIDALRSGRYRQTRGALRVALDELNGEPVFGYCCLGVVEDKRGCTWHDRWGNGGIGAVGVGRWSPDDDRNNYSTLSVAACAWLGVKFQDPYVVVMIDGRWVTRTLTTLNDSHKFTLGEIGDVLADQADDWVGDADGVERQRQKRLKVGS